MTTTLRPKNFVMSQGDIDRAELCPASRVFVGPKMPPHPGMWYGIFLHRFIQYAKERGREEALRYVRKKSKNVLGVCERINVDELPDGMYEEGFTINPHERTAEFAPHDTAVAVEHIYARLDTMFYDPKFDGRPHVVDFKSGERSYDPATSTQLLTLACAVSAACNVSGGLPVSVVNVLKTGELRWHTHEHSEEALDRHWERMRLVHLHVVETRAELREEGAQPVFVPGEHCKNCRAEVACMQRRVDEKRGK